MNRRELLIGGALAALALPTVALARPRGLVEPRRLALQFVHTGAWFRGPYHDGRAYDRGALGEFSRIVADHRTGEVRPVDPPLLDALWRLGQAMGAPALHCVSGYRSPASNRLVGGVDDSTHLIAKAADLHFPPDRLPEAVERAVALRAGGVGAYPGFVHIDVGAMRFWDRRTTPPDCAGRCATARRAVPPPAPNQLAAAPPTPVIPEEPPAPLRPRRQAIDVLPDPLRAGGMPGSPLSMTGIGW